MSVGSRNGLEVIAELAVLRNIDLHAVRNSDLAVGIHGTAFHGVAAVSRFDFELSSAVGDRNVIVSTDDVGALSLKGERASLKPDIPGLDDM